MKQIASDWAGPKKDKHYSYDGSVKLQSRSSAYLRKIAKRTVAGLMRALEACADIFKPAECTNYFAACGYDTT